MYVSVLRVRSRGRNPWVEARVPHRARLDDCFGFLRERSQQYSRMSYVAQPSEYYLMLETIRFLVVWMCVVQSTYIKCTLCTYMYVGFPGWIPSPAVYYNPETTVQGLWQNLKKSIREIDERFRLVGRE